MARRSGVTRRVRAGVGKRLGADGDVAEIDCITRIVCPNPTDAPPRQPRDCLIQCCRTGLLTAGAVAGSTSDRGPRSGTRPDRLAGWRDDLTSWLNRSTHVGGVSLFGENAFQKQCRHQARVLCLPVFALVAGTRRQGQPAGNALTQRQHGSKIRHERGIATTPAIATSGGQERESWRFPLFK